MDSRLCTGAFAALAVALASALIGCGGSHPTHHPPSTQTVATGPGLAIGVAESNANLLWGGPGAPAAPPGFGPWRAALSALHPAYVRLAVDWAALQPVPAAPPTLDAPASGCSRTTPPCATYAGLTDVLRAIASQQRAGGGYQPVIVIFDAPAWAARPASGCQGAAVGPGARPLAPDAVRAYQALVADLIALGRREGVALRYWSAWDEPNHPLFISPQRMTCSPTAPAVSPAIYATLVRALAGALRAAGGSRQIVLGDLADYPTPHPEGASISQFVAGLPGDVVCDGSIWAQHEYPKPGVPGGTPGGVRALERALDARGACGRRAHIWVTETGAGNPHGGGARDVTPAGLAAQCRLMDEALLSWYRDPRVSAAFQYSFREDSDFPVGLSNAALTQLYPTYYLWRAWGGSRAPSAPAPSLPAQCR